MSEASTVQEEPLPRTLAPPGVLEMANKIVRNFPGCFWFRHPDAEIMWLDDVRLVIEHLREYGDHRAWQEAQRLHQCL